MATSRSDQRRRASSSSRKKSRSSSSSSGRKPLQTRDTGYRVGSSRRQKSSRDINPRLIIIGVVGILMVIALIFGISSCVRGCKNTRQTQKTEQEVKVNPADKRVAFGVSSEETAKIAEVLDRNEAFEKIAKNADKITDERLIDLAIAEPDAIPFVAGSLSADGTSQAYDESLPSGEIPLLYTYDTRWGYIDYADGILGVTGSGPTALSMAAMGLTGKNTYDPASVAASITSSNLATGTTGMDDSYVSGHASDVGLTATGVEASSDGIYNPISEGQPVIIKLKSDSGVGSATAHWALVIGVNPDNSVTVYDPTSSYASTHSWSLGAISSRTDTAYALTTGTSTSSSGDASADATYDSSETEG